MNRIDGSLNNITDLIKTNEWSEDIDVILENIRINSIILSNYHKKKYFFLQSRLKYFRIPVIIISAFASVFNIGLQPFIDQGYISIICCLMSLITGLIGSIELFLQVQKSMESDLLYSRDFYLLAIDIFKVISLEHCNRNGDGKTFMEDKFNVYRKMIENSNILDKAIIDQLAPIDNNILKFANIYSSNNMMDDVIKYATNTDNYANKFLSFFWSPSYHLSNSDEEEIKSVNTKERFKIYCNILKRANEFEHEILEKVLPLIKTSHPVYTLPMEDRIQMYCYFISKLNPVEDALLIKQLKPILVGDFFVNNRNKHNSFIYNAFSDMNHAPVSDNIPPYIHESSDRIIGSGISVPSNILHANFVNGQRSHRSMRSPEKFGNIMQNYLYDKNLPSPISDYDIEVGLVASSISNSTDDGDNKLNADLFTLGNVNSTVPPLVDQEVLGAVLPEKFDPKFISKPVIKSANSSIIPKQSKQLPKDDTIFTKTNIELLNKNIVGMS